MAFIEPCFGIGHNLSLICQMTSEDIKHQLIIIILASTETTRLTGDGEKGGKGVWRWGEREIIYLLLQYHHQNDSCIKMGSDDSHFNVSVGSDGQSHRTVSTNHNLFEEKREPKQYRTNVLLLTNLMPYR